MNYNSRDLDNHITGHYGEDQWDDEPPEDVQEWPEHDESMWDSDEDWQEWALSDEYDTEDSRS